MTSRLPLLACSRALDMRFVACIRQRAFAVIRAWQTSMRQRRELLMLSDVELRELSLIAADVNREAIRPFWQNVGLAGR
jgi:uncharacterized protein YjiS (DUF1127 family)